MIYLDTSVILSALDISDSGNAASLGHLERESVKVVTELTMVEFNSVFVRKHINIGENQNLLTNYRLRSYSALIYLLQRFKITYFAIHQEKEKSPLGDLGSVFKMAFEFASEIHMRTLDLLQLAYAFRVKEATNEKIEFLTRDFEFGKYSRQIEEITGLTINVINH